ncbi:MAG: TVP38/TMEM64 family protein [Alphaproteobacteria bacterium]
MTADDHTTRDDRAPGSRSISWRIALAAAVLLGLVALGVLLAFTEMGGNLDVRVLAARIRGLDEWGHAAVIGLMVVHSFVPFPAEILALCAGAVYGTLWGAVLIWIGAMIGASLSFALARWLGRPFVNAMLGPKSRAKFDGWTMEQGAVALLVARFIPVIAFNLINYCAGLTRVGWGTFLWTTGLGIVPLTVLMTAMGSSMMELTWPWLLGLSAAGIAVVCCGHRWAKRRGWLGGGP